MTRGLWDVLQPILPKRRMGLLAGATIFLAVSVVVGHGLLRTPTEAPHAHARGTTTDTGRPTASLETASEVASAYLDGQIFRDCDDACPEMVVIPAGNFLMGSPANEAGRSNDEGRQHQVTIPGFAASKYEITRGEWSAFIAATARADPQIVGSTYCSWRNPGFAQDDRHPVVCVNWNDAQGYVDWLSQRTGLTYRLLSEAEWEYAARGGAATPYWTGVLISPVDANFNSSGTRAVGVISAQFARFGRHRRQCLGMGARLLPSLI